MGMAIQKRFGWPLYLLSFGPMPFHVVAKNPKGGYADVRGPDLSAAEVAKGFKPLVPSWQPTLKSATPKEILEAFDQDPPSASLLEMAGDDLVRFWTEPVIEKWTR